jgi:PilZ domain
MSQARRRYFRCAAEVIAFLTRSDGSNLVCQTANVSPNGVPISSSTTFTLGKRLGIALALDPEKAHALARGVAVWDDKHGKTGISLQCLGQECQSVLDAWLDEHFARCRKTHDAR